LFSSAIIDDAEGMSPGIINESGGLQLKSLSGIDPDSIPAFKLLMNLPLRSARSSFLSAPLLQHDRQFEPGQFAVGVLGSLFLRGGDKARWPVGGPHGAVGLVDMLPARPAGSHGLIVDILLPQVTDGFWLWRQSHTHEPVAPLVGGAKGLLPIHRLVPMRWAAKVEAPSPAMRSRIEEGKSSTPSSNVHSSPILLASAQRPAPIAPPPSSIPADLCPP
jgi:hypothetical protein